MSASLSAPKLPAPTALPPHLLAGLTESFACPPGSSLPSTGLRINLGQIRAAQRERQAMRQAAKSAGSHPIAAQIAAPLREMVDLAEALCNAQLPPSQHHEAEGLRDKGTALLALVNAMLALSPAQIVDPPETFDPFDLEALIHREMRKIGPAALQKGVELGLDYDAALSQYYEGDAEAITDVMQALFAQALTATAQGQILARVIGIALADGRHQLHITVEDSGDGLPQAELDQILADTHAAPPSRLCSPNAAPGSREISRRLIEHRGGAVWIESEAGRGSTLGFRLHLHPSEGAKAPPAQPRLGQVFIVAKSFVTRTILQRHLQGCSRVISPYRTSDDAISALQSGMKPQLIILDVPPAEGGDHLDPAAPLWQKLHALGHDIPLLCLRDAPYSGGAAPESDWLARPILRAELYEKITALLNRAEKKRRLPAMFPPKDAATDQPQPPRETLPATLSATVPKPADAPVSKALAAIPKTLLSAPEPLRVSTHLLPMPALSGPPAAVKIVVSYPASPRSSAHQMPRMLVIADNETNRLVFKKLLAGLSLQLRLATEAQEALDIYQSFGPDLTLIDLSHGAAHNADLAQALRQYEVPGSRRPIYALSTECQNSIPSPALDGVLGKPILRGELHALVFAHMREGLAQLA